MQEPVIAELSWVVITDGSSKAMIVATGAVVAMNFIGPCHYCRRKKGPVATTKVRVLDGDLENTAPENLARICGQCLWNLNRRMRHGEDAPTCIVPGCGLARKAKGYCGKHYQRHYQQHVLGKTAAVAPPTFDWACREPTGEETS